MKQINIYKPRYSVPFLAKSKVWPYKNSRLRRFFNIRGRKLIRGGLFKRYFMVFNNMKWAIARRFIRPYMQRRRPVRRKYKTVFYVKQQLRKFYGKQKEKAFANFFKTHMQNAARRNLSFVSALERRTDIVLFRLRFLPTIYACHQYIHHQGVLINDVKEYSPYALIKPGDCITFEEPMWSVFFNYIWERLHWRSYGLYLWKLRQYKILKKKIWYLRKDKRAKIQNIKLLKKYYKLLNLSKEKIKKLEHFGLDFNRKLAVLKMKFASNSVETQTLDTLGKNYKKLVLQFKTYVYKATLKFRALYKKRKRAKRWKWRNYYAYFYKMLDVVFFLYKHLKAVELRLTFLDYAFYKWFLIYNFDIKNQEREGKLNGFKKQYLEVHSDKQALQGLINTSTETIQLAKVQHKKILTAIEKKEDIVLQEYNLWLEKLIMYKQLLVRRRIKLFSMKPRYFFNKKLNKTILRKSRIKLHLALQRKKRLRHLAISRLKPVHWYVPNYLHFDAATLSAVFLYNPLPGEIMYSFKCSLQNIYSFYRSIGY